MSLVVYSFSQALQHLLGGAVEGGVVPGGGELGEGNEDEIAKVHARMGEGEPGTIDHKVVDGYDVYIYDAVTIASCRVAVGEGRY